MRSVTLSPGPSNLLIVVAALCSSALPACRGDEQTNQAATAPERPTRFDHMEEGAPPPKAVPSMVPKAIKAAERSILTSLDRVMTFAVAKHLTQDPETMDTAAALGERAGEARPVGDQLELRLDGPKGPLFATVASVSSGPAACWATSWQPDWVPVVMTGPGTGVQGETRLVWWRFEQADAPPVLVRFDPDGATLWRPDTDAACYRGESLLGLIGDSSRVFDYLSPMATTGGADPEQTWETAGAKPLLLDILPARGKEQVVAREGRVELRAGKGKVVKRWDSTLPRGSAACTQAAVHQFGGEPQRWFFEIEYTDDEACDEVWEHREVQQTLFEVRGKELVSILSGSSSIFGEGEVASGSATELDVLIPTGDGALRYVGRSNTRQDETGGEKWHDCLSWATDQGVDHAETAFAEELLKGRWTFVAGGKERPIGDVGGTVRTFHCGEAGD